MSAAAVEPGSYGPPVPTSRILAWGLWDWGSAAFNAVIVTFVFSVYLTDAVGDDLPGSVSASSWLGWSLDATGHRKRSLALLTTTVVGCMLAMYFVEDDHHFLWLGLLLLGVGSVLFEL